MGINEKLRIVVEDKGVKLTFLAQKTGMSKDSISKILSGKRKLTADEFLKLCDVIEVSPETFRTGRTA